MSVRLKNKDNQKFVDILMQIPIFTAVLHEDYSFMTNRVVTGKRPVFVAESIRYADYFKVRVTDHKGFYYDKWYSNKDHSAEFFRNAMYQVCKRAYVWI